MALNKPQAVLEEVISDAFGRKTKKGIENADKLRNWFENYYGGEGDPQILNTPLNVLFNDPDVFIERLESGLRSFPNDKQVLAERLSVVLEYAAKKYELKLDLEFLKNFMCRNREERLLRILKYLQGGGRSRAEIAEAFGISERTLSEDMNILTGGFEFLGYKMQVKEISRGSNRYTSLIHPLFLAMRTDEIYSLTVGLKLLSRGTVFEASLGGIADLIYQQLSPYTREIVDRHSEAHQITFGETGLKFIGSDEIVKKESRALLPYFLKEPITCRVTYTEEGQKKTAVGTLHLSDSGDSLQKVLVKNQEKEILIHIDEIDMIEGR